jgi:hypothetical protein
MRGSRKNGTITYRGMTASQLRKSCCASLHIRNLVVKKMNFQASSNHLFINFHGDWIFGRT